MVGEFEYLVLAACLRLGETAYGAAIRQTIEESTGRACSIGALYTTLDRLETKRLIVTRFGEPTAERGGRAKRLVRVTAEGRREAASFYRTVVAISRGLKWSPGTAGR